MVRLPTWAEASSTGLSATREIPSGLGIEPETSGLPIAGRSSGLGPVQRPRPLPASNPWPVTVTGCPAPTRGIKAMRFARAVDAGGPTGRQRLPLDHPDAARSAGGFRQRRGSCFVFRIENRVQNENQPGFTGALNRWRSMQQSGRRRLWPKCSPKQDWCTGLNGEQRPWVVPVDGKAVLGACAAISADQPGGYVVKMELAARIGHHHAQPQPQEACTHQD